MCRHAKSDWSSQSRSDFDRPLNARGRRNAPEMGRRLLEKSYSVDRIVSSTAKRAAETALLVAKGMQFKKEIDWKENLYHANADTIAETLYALKEEWNSIIIVCHNPGITDFVNAQCGVVTENVVTCAMAAFEWNVKTWPETASAQARLLFYDFPKNS